MTKALEIKIDTDKKCKECGEFCAMENGYCMKCATEQVFGVVVGEKTLDAITRQVESLFLTHQEKINQAIKKDAGKLDVSFVVKLVKLQGGVAVQTDISYTPEKIKDHADAITVSENQEELDLQ